MIIQSRNHLTSISIFIRRCLRVWLRLFFKVIFAWKNIKIIILLLFLISTHQNHSKILKKSNLYQKQVEIQWLSLYCYLLDPNLQLITCFKLKQGAALKRGFFFSWLHDEIHQHHSSSYAPLDQTARPQKTLFQANYNHVVHCRHNPRSSLGEEEAYRCMLAALMNFHITLKFI
jgi:hypothetical protein